MRRGRSSQRRLDGVATDDRQVLVTGQASAPATFKVPGNGQITPRVVYAHYDGTGAAVTYVPALKITSDGGELIGIYPATTRVAAAGSAEVSWFPGVGGGFGSGSSQRFVGARIQATVNQNVTSSVHTDLIYDQVYFDTDGMANLGADNRILTVHTAGYYLVACETTWQWLAPNPGRRLNVVTQNTLYSGGPGAQFSSSDSRLKIFSVGTETPRTTNTAIGIFQAAAGDFFASGCLMSVGGVGSGTEDVNGASNCFLAATLIGV